MYNFHSLIQSPEANEILPHNWYKMKDRPTWKHDCEECQYLGTVQVQGYKWHDGTCFSAEEWEDYKNYMETTNILPETTKTADLYFCYWSQCPWYGELIIRTTPQWVYSVSTGAMEKRTRFRNGLDYLQDTYENRLQLILFKILAERRSSFRDCLREKQANKYIADIWEEHNYMFG